MYIVQWSKLNQILRMFRISAVEARCDPLKLTFYHFATSKMKGLAQNFDINTLYGLADQIVEISKNFHFKILRDHKKNPRSALYPANFYRWNWSRVVKIISDLRVIIWWLAYSY